MVTIPRIYGWIAVAVDEFPERERVYFALTCL